MHAILCISLLVLGFTYAGYPLLMLARARLDGRPIEPNPSWRPSVTVLLAARDEGRTLRAKLDSLLDQPWPRDRFEVIVIDDGSRDDTAEIARIYEPWNVRLLRLPAPLGKAAALNLGAAHARGEVLLLTDARQPLQPYAVPHLIAPLGDPLVGAVSGELELPRGEAGLGLDLYRRFDDSLRRAEAATGSSVGVTGALWAMHRMLWTDLPRGTLCDDLHQPLCIARQGYRVVVEPAARVRDVASPDPRGELRRRARTLAGNLQLLSALPWLLSSENPLRFRLVAHKLLRLVAPFALLGALVSNSVLVLREPGRGLYAQLFAAQLLAYGLAALAPSPGSRWSVALERRRQAPSLLTRLARFSRGFVLVHAAALWALWSWLRGDEGSLWRSQPARDLRARKRPGTAAAGSRPRQPAREPRS